MANRNRYTQHKHTGLNIFATILAILVLAACTLGGLELWGTGKQKPSNWFKKTTANAATPEYETVMPANGGMTMPDKVEDGEEDGGEVKSSGIALMSAAIPVYQYADYGISPAAETARTVTATVTPDNDAPNTAVKWTIEWKNPASEWATGKDVTTYVTISFDGSDFQKSKTCTVTCNEAFGEQIVLKAAAVEDETKFATCTADYVQQVKSVKASIGNVSVNLGGNTDLTINIRADNTNRGGKVTVTPALSDVYTIKSDYTATASLTTPKNNSLYYVETKYEGGDRENVYVTRVIYDADEDLIEDSIYFDRRLFTQFNFYARRQCGLTPNLPKEPDELFTTKEQISALIDTFNEDRMGGYNGPFKGKAIWTMKVTLSSERYTFTYESDLVWAEIDEKVQIENVDINDGNDLIFP